MDILTPVIYAAALKMTDFQRAARLLRDLDHFPHALHHTVAFASDMGGDHTSVFSHRLQNISKFIGARIAFGQIHYPKGYAHGPPLHGILDQCPCRIQFLSGIRRIRKRLHRNLYRARTDHRRKIDCQRRFFQCLQIISVGSRQLQFHRSQHRLVKIIHLPCPRIRIRAGCQADPAVSHHRSRDPLCQLPLSEKRII